MDDKIAKELLVALYAALACFNGIARKDPGPSFKELDRIMASARIEVEKNIK